MASEDQKKPATQTHSFGFSEMVLRVARRLERMVEEGYRGRVIVHFGDDGKIAKFEANAVVKAEEI